MAESFRGFRPEAVQFLVDLTEHNERAWFQPRKADYERLLKTPLEALCAALDAAFAGRGVPLSADPKRSPFPIHRDVRFSRDKSPYKTHASASFPWTGDGGMVGGYFHLQPGAVFVGGGMWHPAPERLAGWRTAVVEDRDLRAHQGREVPRSAAHGGMDERWKGVCRAALDGRLSRGLRALAS